MPSRLLALLCVAAFASRSAAEPVDFAHDVLPILKSRCAECHTDGKYKGHFSLDNREAVLKTKAVVPGDSGQSKLIQRVTSTDPEKRMPPKGDALTPKQVAVLRAWIDQKLPW